LSIPPFFIPQGAVPLRLDAWQICYLYALLPGCLDASNGPGAFMPRDPVAAESPGALTL